MVEATLGSGRGAPRLNQLEAGRLIALLLPLALLGGALGSEHIGGLLPCEMCFWQRWPHGAAILLAGFAFTARAASHRSRVFTLLAAFAMSVSGAIGVYHAGVELGVFSGFTTCAIPVRAATTDELLKQLMQVPLIRCDQVQWAFLGISMAGWNAILSLGGAAAVAWLTVIGKRAA
jgi:disulfide bond formation protein DsbB